MIFTHSLYVTIENKKNNKNTELQCYFKYGGS